MICIRKIICWFKGHQWGYYPLQSNGLGFNILFCARCYRNKDKVKKLKEKGLLSKGMEK